jgi:hypothetical protein
LRRDPSTSSSGVGYVGDRNLPVLGIGSLL